MMLKNNFELMADYNRWMNESIFSAAKQLSESDLAVERGAFFGSIIGTLNHILVGDTIWLKRFSEHPSSLPSLDYVRSIAQPETLDSILYSDFTDLYTYRKKMDGTIVAFCSELTESILESSLAYKNTKGSPFEKSLGALIQHFFNHQTHHRGQVSTLLNQAGVDIGVTDLLVRIPNPVE